ncbi:MAG: acyl-[acyl-carrier-protein]--UDP-N-acetylglucosamine O-acyltransferase [Thermodesulfovibrio sp.]|nr:acyl-[acyl-carrier-protein]--UDP-N-acetylglucosamine O-acyltransferase [Thermodesulfovibrio sp.]
MSTKIHPTAVVERGAELDTSVEVGPYCIVRKGVSIGKGSRLLSHVVIEGSTMIGEDCVIHPFATIGLPPQDLKYKGENTKLLLGNKNIIREYVSIHRGSVGGDGATVVGNSNFIMAYVHIAHDCRIGSHIIMANSVMLGGHVVIEDHVVIGGIAGIHQYTRVGKYVMVGGLSRITQDVPPFMIVSGVEPKLFGPNSIGLKRHGFTDSEVNDLKKAYKILFRQKNTVGDAIKKIHDEMELTDNLKHLIEFLEKNKRGISR